MRGLGRAPASTAARWLLCVVCLGALVGGCETYAETVGCRMGQVLNEDDECVPPPVPDGGVQVASCAELCQLLPDWSAAQLECLTTQLGSFGPPPAECMGDLSDPATCQSCTATAGATAEQCATLNSLCP